MIIKRFKWLLPSIVLMVAFTFCKRDIPESVNKLAASFSELECRAFTLREARYALADKIRFTEDSISKSADAPAKKIQLQTNLTHYLIEKDNTLAASLRLADTIKTQLDSITKIRLHDTAKTRLFDDALSAELKKKHCM